MSDSFPMTPACLQRLRDELRQLKSEERAKNVAEIEAALEHGDLRENAEYHAAKERQAALDARMRYLEQRIARANVLDPATIESDTVGFGATVTLLDMETEQTKVYALVGEDESDVDRGHISINSPIARALVGKREGDIVTVRLPRGEVEYEISELVYQALQG